MEKVFFISIHALVKRATYTATCSAERSRNFNPRPREKGDIVINGSWRYPSNFNPRPREKGDFLWQTRAYRSWNFNPRPREKGDYLFLPAM